MILPVLILLVAVAPDHPKRAHDSQHQEGGEQSDLRGQIAEMLTAQKIIQAAPDCWREDHENSTEGEERNADVMTSAFSLFSPCVIGDADRAARPCDQRQLRVGVASADCSKQGFASFVLMSPGILHQRPSAVATFV